jgi:Spy/CpxP family protein refolding chaperone
MSALRNFALVAAAAVSLAGAAQAQSAITPPASTGTARGHRGQGGERMGLYKDLNLTAAQKAQIKAIHTKYQPQFKTARDQAKPYMDAARVARQKGDTATARADMLKARGVMQSTAAIRTQEMNEVRAVLTPAQQAKFDARLKAYQARGANRGNGRRGNWRKGGQTTSGQ